MNAFSIFLLFVILQRIVELSIAKRNERIVRSKGAVEFDKNGYKFIVVMHFAFFISLILEKVFLERSSNSLWVFFVILFVLAQLLRYWAISSLGVYWNTRVLVVPNSKLVSSGPYKYLRHPNYVSVMTEIAVIPLIFSCYITAALFSGINLILLRRRVKIEEEALSQVSTGF
ncbi:MAG: isoprenylcysteine carboxyl methyltransferase family protein [Thermodesulfobacteriota bacterium]